jgi:hypothetical protein
VQLAVFAVVWVFGYEFWLLPNLWSDEPVWELLKPTYTFKKSGPGALWMRLGVVALLGAVGYYFATAPPGELDLFLDQQKQFVNDLYAGTLLTDGSTQGKGGGAAKDRYAGMGYGKRHGGVQVPDISEVRARAECAPPAPDVAPARPPLFPPPPRPAAARPAAPQFEKMFEEEDKKAEESAAPGADDAHADGAAAAADEAAAAAEAAAARAAEPDLDALLASHDEGAPAAPAAD